MTINDYTDDDNIISSCMNENNCIMNIDASLGKDKTLTVNFKKSLPNTAF